MNKVVVLLKLLLILGCSQSYEEPPKKEIPIVIRKNTLEPMLKKSIKLIKANKIDEYLNECFITRDELKTLHVKFYGHSDWDEEEFDNDYKKIKHAKKLELEQFRATKPTCNLEKIMYIDILNKNYYENLPIASNWFTDVSVKIKYKNKFYKMNFTCVQTYERGWVMYSGYGTISEY